MRRYTSEYTFEDGLVAQMKYSLHVTAWDSAECDKRELASGPVATFLTSGADGGNDSDAEVGRSRLTPSNHCFACPS